MKLRSNVAGFLIGALMFGPLLYASVSLSSGSGMSFGSSSGGTATRVLFTDGSGNLADDADMTFVTDTLSLTKISLNSGEIVSGGASSTNTALIIDNKTNAKAILDLKDNGTSKVTVADGGTIQIRGMQAGTNLLMDAYTSTALKVWEISATNTGATTLAVGYNGATITTGNGTTPISLLGGGYFPGGIGTGGLQATAATYVSGALSSGVEALGGTSTLYNDQTTIAHMRSVGPTYQGSVAGRTVTSIASLWIDGAPIVGGNLTVTNSIALLVDNKAAPARIFEARDNGTTVLTIPDGGGLQFYTSSKPSCAVGTRGTIFYVAGGGGVLDTLEVCRKDAADAYAWTTLF